MNMADRIQYLRKAKGLSQEQLADRVGVSRQAVSKWESEQATPDLEKIIRMSDLFGVTTDYILKGIEPAADRGQSGRAAAGRVLCIAAAALVAIGLFCAFGGWYEKQTMDVVWGAMAIQAVGVAGYFIAGTLSGEKAPFWVSWLTVLGAAFIPVSMVTGYVSETVFRVEGGVPYPVGIFHTALFGAAFCAIAVESYGILKKKAGG